MSFLKSRKFWRRTLIVLLVLLVAGGISAHFIGKRLGYRNGWHFITSFGSHYAKGVSAKYETIDIKMDKADFKKIEKIRDEAVKVGMQLPVADPWVKAKITYKGKEIKVKMRLKGHMTDHLQGKKWSFRIKTRKGHSFMGMRLFTIQHPGTRGYAYEWIFHEVMRKEGLLALRYDFINVNLNGDNLGIYALEENFGEELLEYNKKPAGPILRFNPDLYWEFRKNELKGERFLHPGGQFSASYLEPYDDKTIYSDSSLLQSYAEAVRLMQKFRSGELSTSQAFDHKMLATYHAWIDLIGGTHSIDWTDVKYYYNPQRKLFEPVIYESFSAFPVYSLAGRYRAHERASSGENLHDLLFSDSVFFSAYMQELERMSDPQWMNSTLKSIDKDLQTKLAILYSEWPYRDFNTGIYSKNAATVQKMLKMPSHVNAYVDRLTKDSLFVFAAELDGFPVIVDGFYWKELNLMAGHSFMIPSRAPGKAPSFSTYAIAIPDSLRDRLKADDKFVLRYHIPGQSHQGETQTLPLVLQKDLGSEITDLASVDFLQVSHSQKQVLVSTGAHILKQNIRLPQGYSLRMGPATQLDLQEGAGIQVYGPIQFEGTDEQPIVITSSDQTGKGIYIESNSESKIYNTSILQMQGTALDLYGGKVVLRNVQIGQNTGNGISATRCQLNLFQCLIASSNENDVLAQYAKLVVDRCVITKAEKSGIKITGSELVLTDSKISEGKKNGIFADQHTTVRGVRNSITQCKTGIKAEDGSQVQLKETTLENLETGLATEHHKDVYGSAKIDVHCSVMKKVKTEKKQAPETQITLKK